MNPNDYHPIDDGMTHINVYSKAGTRLGRALSNFSKLHFEHPIYGWFQSVEAFWYYVSTGFQHEDLRTFAGHQAKQLGRSYPRVPIDEETFRHHIRVALDARFAEHPWLAAELTQTTLPLVHYYYFGNPDNPKVVVPSTQWVTEYLDRTRQRIRSSISVPKLMP